MRLRESDRPALLANLRRRAQRLRWVSSALALILEAMLHARKARR